MNGLKIGIIGLFILLPFLFLSYVQVEQRQSGGKADRLVERAAAGAMRDGVFALKSYSRFSYDGLQSKKIEIAEKETRDTINRSFAYALNAKTESEIESISRNIRLIGFVAYDALILYDQRSGQRLHIPFYQMKAEGAKVVIEKRGIEESGADADLFSPEQILEKILTPYAAENQLLLPEHRSTLFGNDYSEVGIFMVIKGDPLQIGEEQNYFKIGKVSLSERKGLKIKEISEDK